MENPLLAIFVKIPCTMVLGQMLEQLARISLVLYQLVLTMCVFRVVSDQH